MFARPPAAGGGRGGAARAPLAALIAVAAVAAIAVWLLSTPAGTHVLWLARDRCFAPELSASRAEIERVRAAFNAHLGATRVLAILSPT